MSRQTGDQVRQLISKVMDLTKGLSREDLQEIIGRSGMFETHAVDPMDRESDTFYSNQEIERIVNTSLERNQSPMGRILYRTVTLHEGSLPTRYYYIDKKAENAKRNIKRVKGAWRVDESISWQNRGILSDIGCQFGVAFRSEQDMAAAHPQILLWLAESMGYSIRKISVRHCPDCTFDMLNDVLPTTGWQLG